MVAIDKTVYVVDAMMGQGKTSAAITYINEAPQTEKFFFITPYVDEGKRVHDACASRDVVVLEKKRGSKLNDLRFQVGRRHDVASTHALLERYTPEIIEQIRAGNYTLILDEAYAVTRTVTRTEQKNFQCLLENGIIAVDPETSIVQFADGTPRGFDGTSMDDLVQLIASGAVYYFHSKILVWVFPIHILEAFSKIIILTYLFQAQHIYYYLRMHGARFEYLGTKKIGDHLYRFCPYDERDLYGNNLRELIHILYDDKLNAIGASDKALCSKWAANDKAHYGGEKLKKLGRNIRNVQKNIFKCSTKDFYWTCYQDYIDIMADKNIVNKWLAFNAKATNQWGHCHYLAYGINLHEQPDVAKYYEGNGFQIDQDKWALSEMIQWIWRSAIRNGEEIWIYIPSARMRGLLEQWIDEMSTVGGDMTKLAETKEGTAA